MPTQLLSIRDVCKILRVGKSTVYAWIARGRFPTGSAVTTRCRRWTEEEIQQWHESLPQSRFSEDANKALWDRQRAGLAGAAALRSAADEFWFNTHRAFLASGLDVRTFAARHCGDGEEPIFRVLKNKSQHAFSFETICKRLKDLERPRPSA